MATLKERRAAAEARAREAEAMLTPEMLADIEEREAIERAEKREREAFEKLKMKGLAERVDAAEEKHGKARGVAPDGCSHTFVVIDPGTDAYKAWETGINADVLASATGKKAPISIDRVRTDFAVAAVADWNGMTDFSGATENGALLIKFLSDHPAIRAEVISAAIDMAKAAAEERKSPG